MTVREFLKQALGSEGLCQEILDHEVKIQMRTFEGLYIGNSFVIDRCGYKFNPLRKNSDGTMGALVLDIRIIPLKDN